MLPDSKFHHYYNELFLEEYCYPPDHLQKEYREWILKFGESQRSKSDFIWSMFNVFLRRLAKKVQSEHELYSYQRKITLDMIRFRIDEGKSGKQLYYLRRKINLTDLHLATLTGCEVDVIILGCQDCKESQELRERVFTIEEALAQQIIPYSKCSRYSGCICLYGTQARRDHRGRLIMKKE